MKRIIIGFFATLGVIFFILIVLGVYLFITDPYNIKPLFFSAQTSSENENQTVATSTQSTISADKNPLLSDTQEKALEKVGVNPETLPTQITPEQEACFIEIIGVERVNQIKAGGLPTASEFFKARSCL
jgi:hypothetical protein